MLYEWQLVGVRAKGRSQRCAQFAQNIFNDHSYSYFCRREPKRLLVSRVEKGKSSQSFDDEFVILINFFFYLVVHFLKFFKSFTTEGI